jgi:phosphoribosylformylglycinamidine synthase PurS subunit|tara:strand:- start:493 stop:720 length:228 start_codon:yes stop_codon:yes gene_type:complete
MRYRAMICIRRGILDNAGQTVTYALQSLGWPEVQDVRIDKVIEFDLEESDWDKAEAIAKSQTNEVMEYYELEEIN